MRRKLINYLLDNNVVFTKIDKESSIKSAFFGVSDSIEETRVYGDTKEEILEGMILIEKEHLKISKLPTLEEFIHKFKEGNLDVNLNNVYKFKYSQFIGRKPTYIEEKTGFDILKDLFSTMYYYMEYELSTTEGAIFKVKRRNNIVDMKLWGNYPEIREYFHTRSPSKK